MPFQPLQRELTVNPQPKRIPFQIEPDTITKPELEAIAPDALFEYLLDFSENVRVLGFLMLRGHTGSRNLPLGN
jgi:hypothetical protein